MGLRPRGGKVWLVEEVRGRSWKGAGDEGARAGCGDLGGSLVLGAEAENWERVLELKHSTGAGC